MLADLIVSRYPFVCCELLLLHLDCLLELLKLEANALEVIWAYLQASERIDSQILVYITRILAALFSKSSKTVQSPHLFALDHYLVHTYVDVCDH